MISPLVRLSRLPVGSSARRVRIVRQRARDRDALLLPAGQLARAVFLAPAEAHGLEQLRGVTLALAPRHAREHHGQRDVLRRAHRRDQVERLEDDADVLLAVKAQLGAGHLREVLVEDAQRPRRGAIEPGDQVEQRGLARSGGPQQADEIPLFDRDGHAVQGADGGAAHLVMLLEITCFEQGGHGTLQYKAMAALIEAIEIKRKMFFEYEGAPYHTIDVEVSRPTARGGQTLVRIKMRNMITKAVFDKTFKAGDKFAEPDLELIDATFQYADSAGYHFMDQETVRHGHPSGRRRRATTGCCWSTTCSSRCRSSTAARSGCSSRRTSS
jgi:translation elongation factor P/translation initiation factor 5A